MAVSFLLQGRRPQNHVRNLDGSHSAAFSPSRRTPADILHGDRFRFTPDEFRLVVIGIGKKGVAETEMVFIGAQLGTICIS